jgi:hypothetical protein
LRWPFAKLTSGSRRTLTNRSTAATNASLIGASFADDANG